jgi:hypothetical protein
VTPRRERALSAVAGVVAATPVVVAAARAVARDWYPVQDNALYALRARDVLTEHHPLLGTWSSASLTAGTHLNHPGPLYFDLLAIPARIDPIAGVPVGVALIACACIAGMVIAAHRRGGARAGVLAATAAAALVWTMGSELVVDPWQPNAMLVPFACFLVLAWAVAGGDVALVPWTVLVGSLVLQTHGSYIALVPGVGAITAALWVWRSRRTRGARDAPFRARRWAVVALAVGVLAWSQPVGEQLFGEGEGNLSRLVSSGGSEGPTIGTAMGVRLVAGVEAVPPWWLRPSLGETYITPLGDPIEPGDVPSDAGVPSAWVAVIGLGGLAAVLALSVLWARRHDDRSAADALVLAGGALVLALVTAASQPYTPAIGIGAHQVLWLWPLGAFIAFAVGLTLTRTGRATLAGALALVTVLAALAVPYRNGAVGPRSFDYAMPVMRELAPQLDALRSEGTVLFDYHGMRFGEPYSTPVLLELARRGVEFVVDTPGLARQVGESRRPDGPVDARIYLIEGSGALEPQGADRRIALVSGLDDAGQEELRAVTALVESDLASAPLRLTARGRLARERDRYAGLDLLGSGGTLPTDDARLLATRGQLREIVTDGCLDLDGARRDLYERFARLRHRAERETVGVFLSEEIDPLP